MVLVPSGPTSSVTLTAGPKQHICATGRYLLQEKEERSASQGSVYFLHIQREAASADLYSLLNAISDCLAYTHARKRTRYRTISEFEEKDGEDNFANACLQTVV